MDRPTADHMYARARHALEDAERMAGSHGAATGKVRELLEVATAYRELAESLADRESARSRDARRGRSGWDASRGTVAPASDRPVKP